jgi:hypothetical protein
MIGSDKFNSPSLAIRLAFCKKVSLSLCNKKPALVEARAGCSYRNSLLEPSQHVIQVPHCNKSFRDRKNQKQKGHQDFGWNNPNNCPIKKKYVKDNISNMFYDSA